MPSNIHRYNGTSFINVMGDTSYAMQADTNARLTALEGATNPAATDSVVVAADFTVQTFETRKIGDFLLMFRVIFTYTGAALTVPVAGNVNILVGTLPVSCRGVAGTNAPLVATGGPRACMGNVRVNSGLINLTNLGSGGNLASNTSGLVLGGVFALR